MMSSEEWRRPEKRQAIVRKIAEAVRMFPEVLTRNPGDVEATIYNKAKSEHEYMNMVGKIVLSIKHRGMGLMQQHQQQQQQHPPQQPGGWQQQPGSEMIQRPQGMIEWDHMNQGLTGGVPQPDPTGYPGFQPGMHPMQPHYGQHSGMGMPRMMNQPTPQSVMYNMPQSGGPMMQRHPHMGSHPGMVRPPMNPPPFMTRGMPPGPMPPMRPIMNMTSMQGSGEQVVTALPNPYTTGVDPAHQPPGHPSGAPSPYSGSASSSVYQPPHPTASSGAPPPQPHPPQTNSPKPRPPQAPSPRQPIPSPNTPWNPNSPSINTSPGQPSGQPSITPEANTAVLLKLQELQPYIPLLARMIDRLNRAKGSSDEKSRSDQLSKLNSLYNVLQSKNMKVPLQTLEKCHQALKKLFVEKETGVPSLAPSTSTAPTTSDSLIAPSTPSRPPIPSTPPISSTSLHNFKMLHSPPPLSSYLYPTLDSDEDPLDRLPPEKRAKLEEQISQSFHYALKREINNLRHFKVKQIQLPNKHEMDHSVTLECTLIDDSLPTMPPLIVNIPREYPSVSPECQLTSTIANKEDSPAITAVIEGVEKLLKEKLSHCGHNYTLTCTLQNWEAAIIEVVARDLSDDKE